jgi:hypothetical protein
MMQAANLRQRYDASGLWQTALTGSAACPSPTSDEYLIVVQACYILIINGQRIAVKAGEGSFIQRGRASSVILRTRSSEGKPTQATRERLDRVASY